MCGIAAVYNFKNEPNTEKMLRAMTSALTHRGPDGEGVWFNESKQVALGHRRLSILDLSDAGKQPMASADGRYQIVFNGEIYNFIEIKKELEKLGNVFTSSSDTEVLLAGYATWGKDVMAKCNGMWALVIYDSQTKDLFVSRDRFGVKPLYYYQDDTELLIASEVQALHQVLGPTHPLSDAVLSDVARGGFVNQGSRYTYLSDVYALEAGHNLLVRNQTVAIEKWYTLKAVPVPPSFTEQTAALKTLLEDACGVRLRSDVPIGTCLSGGVDSGSITALINNPNLTHDQRFNHNTHRSFCVSFPGSPTDESEAARTLAAQLGAQLDVIEVNCPSIPELEEAMVACDGPMHSLAFYPIWKLYGYIKKQGITVTLDGQGPDEMLGGYRSLPEALTAAFQRHSPGWFKDVFETYAAQGESDQFSAQAAALNDRKNFWRIAARYYIKKIASRFGLLRKQFAEPTPPAFITNAFDESLYKQFFYAPLPGILNQYDRCSMAHGVECRMPFMDYRIVEFVFSLPPESKVGGGYTKRVLREAMNGVLPDAIRLQKKKIGFNAPIVNWFRGGLKEWMQAQMNMPSFIACPYFDGQKIRSEFNAFVASQHPTWSEAWKFWGPVHIHWWLNKKALTNHA